MTARLPARYGAQTSLPSRVQDSVRDWSQAWLFSNWPRLPERSWRAPAAAYLATRVLPSSTTSGGLGRAKAGSSLVVMLFHCCSSTLTVSLGWAFFHSALTASTTAGGALPSISQMVRVRGPVWALDWPPSSDESPQAAAPRTRARARARAAVMRCRSKLDMGPSSLLVDSYVYWPRSDRESLIHVGGAPSPHDPPRAPVPWSGPWTTAPSTTVTTTRRAGSSSTRSASLPGSRLPLASSTPIAWAALRLAAGHSSASGRPGAGWGLCRAMVAGWTWTVSAISSQRSSGRVRAAPRTPGSR